MKIEKVTAKVPGRVEIIGNHTDYNGGFVIPAAIDEYTTANGNILIEPLISLSSTNVKVGKEVQIPLEVITHSESPEAVRHFVEEHKLPDWILYPLGVAYFSHLAMKDKGLPGINYGFKINFKSDIPLSAGLSSSASLEIVTLNMIKQFFPFKMELKDEALLCQAAENKVRGAPCGNMDQFAVLNGNLTFLDSRTLEYATLQLPAEFLIGVLNTGVKHDNRKSYAERRAQCEQAMQYLAEAYQNPAITHLRDITREQLVAQKGKMDDLLYRRASHIIGENKRAKMIRGALQPHVFTVNEVYNILYSVMAASHKSSNDDFENSCPELNIAVDLFHQHDIAARLSGGGFGGSVVAILRRGEEGLLQTVFTKYQNAMRGTTLQQEPTARKYQVAQGAYLGGR